MGDRVKTLGRLAAFAIAALFSAAASAHPPWAIAADPSGQVYFSDLEAVWRVGPDRRVHLVRPSSGRHVHEIRLDGAGNLIGEELGYDPGRQTYSAGIWRITPKGAQTWRLPPTGAPPKGRGIWTDARGNSFHVQWTDNETRRLLVMRRDARGAVTALVGAPRDVAAFAPTVLYNAGGFALAAAGGAYFTDRSNLYAYAPATGVRRLAGIRGAELRGVATGRGGRLYIADSAGRQVLRRDADGTFHTVMRTEAGWSPHGVALSSDALFTLEFSDYRRGAQGRLRIRKLDQAGRVTLIAARPTA